MTTFLDKMELITWCTFVKITFYTKDIPDTEFGMGLSRVIRDHWVGEMLAMIAVLPDIEDIEKFIYSDKIFDGDVLLSLMKISERDSKVLFLQLEDKYVWQKHMAI
jgi:hypothetical protein